MNTAGGSRSFTSICYKCLKTVVYNADLGVWKHCDNKHNCDAQVIHAIAGEAR